MEVVNVPRDQLKNMKKEFLAVYISNLMTGRHAGMGCRILSRKSRCSQCFSYHERQPLKRAKECLPVIGMYEFYNYDQYIGGHLHLV